MKIISGLHNIKGHCSSHRFFVFVCFYFMIYIRLWTIYHEDIVDIVTPLTSSGLLKECLLFSDPERRGGGLQPTQAYLVWLQQN